MKFKNLTNKLLNSALLKGLIIQLEDKEFIELNRKHKDKSCRKFILYMKSRNFFNPIIWDLNYINLSEDIRAKKVHLAK